MTFIWMGVELWLRLGDIRESWETGDSREEEDTQWRQVVTLYNRILRTFTGSVYFVMCVCFVIPFFALFLLLLYI